MDISSLRERSGSGPMTVTELNSFIKNMFDGNRLLQGVSVTGEISNFTAHKSGHLYFSVKDTEGQIRAVMFRSAAAGLKFIPENGMKVILRGSVSVFVRDGSYQLYVTSMQPDGVGALYLAYAVGACVGNRGARVNAVVEELGGEKIDIILWNEDPLAFIYKALSPATVLSVTAKGERSAIAIVPDDKLSLAIGRDGQNARLAARLTGWKIDVKSASSPEAVEILSQIENEEAADEE